MQESNTMNFDDLKTKFRPNSFQHKVIAILSKEDGTSASLRRDTGTGCNKQRAEEILESMKYDGLIRSVGNGTWSITNGGLHISVTLGPVSKNSITKRSTEEKASELFKREEYVPTELGFTCLRQGAYDAYILPSRIADTLYYPSGRKEIIGAQA